MTKIKNCGWMRNVADEKEFFTQLVPQYSNDDAQYQEIDAARLQFFFVSGRCIAILVAADQQY